MEVYIIRDLVSGMEYVGTSVRSARSRWCDHLSAAFGKAPRQQPLYRAMRERGRDSFSMEVVSVVASYEEMLAEERRIIAERNTVWPSGFNIVKGGRGNFGWVPSPETRSKIAAAASRRVLSAETRAKISAALKGRPAHNKGVKTNKPAWNRGVRASLETRQKLSSLRCGKPLSVAHRLSFTGLKRTAETRSRISQNKREWWASRKAEAVV